LHTNPLEILIADDHPMIRDGIISMIESEPRFRLVAEVGDGNAAVDAYRRYWPDVTLLDLRMPDCDGALATERILRINPSAHVVILTSFCGEEDVFRCLNVGARSYVLKDADRAELVRCILLTSQGRRYLPELVAAKLADRFHQNQLSEREIAVLQLLAAGDENKVIGASLDISENTVKFHVRNILTKLKVRNRLQAVQAANERGMLQSS
jgi:two-component system, NarL family, response regulator